MLNRAFFDETLPRMVAAVGGPQRRVTVTAKLRNGESYFLWAVPRKEDGYCVCVMDVPADGKPLRLMAFPYEAFEWVYATAADDPAEFGGFDPHYRLP